MSNQIDTCINAIDKMGDEFLETIIQPIAKGTWNFAVNDNKLAQAYLTFKTAFMKNKISLFLKYIIEKEDVEVIDFITSLDNGKKRFFIESINKAIDLDDSLQIYILAKLCKQFKTNEELSYFENSLYYSIKQISEDDYTIFYDYYKSLDKPVILDNFYCLKSNDDMRVRLIFRKFENMIGFLTKAEKGSFGDARGSCVNKDEENLISICYQFNLFSEQLYSYIDEYKNLSFQFSK